MKPVRLLLVDDSPDVLAAFAKPLQHMTDGRAVLMPHTGESAEQLADRILAENPEWLLLDFNLLGLVRGDDVLEVLLEKDPEFRCIGFSSVEDVRESFLEAGAVGFVLKTAHDPEASLREVAALIAEHEAS